MTHSDATVLSVTYVSTAETPLSPSALEALLTQSREDNERTGLTGLLAVRGANFFQVIEGPAAAIHRLLASLHQDPRHIDMRVLLEETLPHRQFPDWTMRCERLDDYSPDAIPGYEVIQPGVVRAPHEPSRLGLADLMRWFKHRASRAGTPTTP